MKYEELGFYYGGVIPVNSDEHIIFELANDDVFNNEQMKILLDICEDNEALV